MIKLEGGCFVKELDDLKFIKKGNWEEALIINSSNGAKYLSQYYLKVNKGLSPIRCYPNSDVVLYVIEGKGTINISGREYTIKSETGIYVKINEAFQIDNPNRKSIHIIITICPECPDSLWPDKMPNNFDRHHKKRIVGLSERSKTTTGDRFYQLLVGKKMGSSQVTQFIGSIPKSKAPEHYHLYEEAILILNGKGIMWAGETQTPVKSGSMIFLPKKQMHCLQCITDGGLKLMGVFYPAGSPKTNYKH